MIMRIAIIGAGHAGVEAAVAACKAGARVSLFSEEPLLPYFRPRLVALAFGQVQREAVYMHPEAWYAGQGIDLRLNTPVRALDPKAGALVAGDSPPEPFDAFVLACGAHPIRPTLANAPVSLPILPIWSIAEAEAVRAHVRPGASVTVLGGGILGIETALRAREVGLAVTLVERMDRLMPLQFAPDGSAMLRRLLELRGIVVRTGVSTTGADLGGDFVALTIGAGPNLDLAKTAGLTVIKGVVTDVCLQTSHPRVFAAGDMVQFPGSTRPCVREAVAQGRSAGINAVAAASGRPLEIHTPQNAPLTFKGGDLELASSGHPGGSDTELRLLAEETLPNTFRALVLQNGTLTGVQMVGIRKDFDTWTQRLGEPYP
jgi:3-phenylpropionate/trans-cinnamate dioxygenase ferredoxin reductase component